MVSESWYSKLAELESSSGQNLVGDGGRSRGWYHMGRAAWEDVSRRRSAQHLQTVPWKTGSRSKEWCDVYARDHVAFLAQQLSKQLGRCTEQLIYAAWNAGLESVIRVKGSFDRLPDALRRRAFLFSGAEIKIV